MFLLSGFAASSNLATWNKLIRIVTGVLPFEIVPVGFSRKDSSNKSN